MNHNMTPQQLKNSILQLAIQGKLVEQRPEEGTGAELYKEIQAEKKRLVKAGKLKKEKPLPEISEEEKPFDIPESWVWVKVGSIGSWSSGATPSRSDSDYYGGTIPWLKTGDLNDSYIDTIPETITQKALTQTSVRLNPIGSILMAMYGATIGKLGILQIEATTNQACCACIPYAGIYNKFLFYFLMAKRPHFIKMGEGGAQPNISKEKIVQSAIPLPPLAEQRRIVEKIESLLPFIDRYAKAWERLEAFNTRFPLDMRKSLLQLAIQGMLVEQRAEEGTGDELYREIQKEKKKLIAEGKLKKEKPLPEIAEDEISFEIPKSWKWVRVGHLVETITSGSRDWAQYYSENGDKFIRMGNLSRDSFEMRLDKIQHVTPPDGAEGNRTSLQEDDLLFSITAEIGLLGLIPANFGKAYINQHTAMIRFLSFLRNRYVPYLLLSDYAHKFYNGNGHGIKNSFRLDKIAQLPVPLPPLAEQKRIVAKLNEMLPLCDGLKG